MAFDCTCSRSPHDAKPFTTTTAETWCHGSGGRDRGPLFHSFRRAGGPGQAGRNDRIRVGTISCGGRVSLLVDQLPEQAQIVAICDCNLPRAEEFRAKRKAKWPVYQHYRKLLERKDIDAVIIGTQEFQRVLLCVHACQAGKDVYAEKPLTLYVREGRVLVIAAAESTNAFSRWAPSSARWP